MEIMSFNESEHNEFVVKYKNGEKDWIDPVINAQQDKDNIYILGSGGYTYTFEKKIIDCWIIRKYSSETTYDPI